MTASKLSSLDEPFFLTLSQSTSNKLFVIPIETEFPQPSSKDKGHTKSSQKQSLPHTMGVVCTHCKLRNHTEDSARKRPAGYNGRLLQQHLLPASSSVPTSCNPTSTLLQQTHVQPLAYRSSSSSCSLNSMISTQQQSNTLALAAEQQDSIRGEEEYDKFYESQ